MFSTRRTDKKTWGAMSTALRRMAPPAYADGVKIPRGPIQLKNGLKNHLRYHFDSVACLNHPFLNF